MKIIVTAFEPFGGRDTNSSLDTLRGLADSIGGAEIIKLELPVVFDECFEVLKKRIEEIKPDAIICLGQAEGRGAITPEFIGVNVDYASLADNSGKTRVLNEIVKGAAAGYRSTLPIEEMTRRMNDSGVKAAISFTAGTYVCNNLMFHILYYTKDSDIKAGFIHLPLSSNTGETRCPTMSESDLIKGITICVECVAKEIM